jgi:hypothetical protein
MAGGALAIASAWLPWAATGGEPLKPIDIVPTFSELTKDPTNLVNVDYLLAAGIVAVVIGLVVLIRLAPILRPLLALVVIAAGVLVIGVEISAYNKITETIKVYPTYSIGYGLYAGIGGGVAAVLGGLAALFRK